MKWKTIRLELAPTADFPKGSVGRGFLIRAPMDNDGRVHVPLLAETPHRATVRRVWPNEPDEHGKLVWVDDQWAMRFPGRTDRLIEANGSFRAGKEVLVRLEGESSPFIVRIFDSGAPQPDE